MSKAQKYLVVIFVDGPDGQSYQSEEREWSAVELGKFRVSQNQGGQYLRFYYPVTDGVAEEAFFPAEFLAHSVVRLRVREKPVANSGG
jgi:hypothetical protein